MSKFVSAWYLAEVIRNNHVGEEFKVGEQVHVRADGDGWLVLSGYPTTAGVTWQVVRLSTTAKAKWNLRPIPGSNKMYSKHESNGFDKVAKLTMELAA